MDIIMYAKILRKINQFLEFVSGHCGGSGGGGHCS
jgi:hypothetical protein